MTYNVVSVSMLMLALKKRYAMFRLLRLQEKHIFAVYRTSGITISRVESDAARPLGVVLLLFVYWTGRLCNHVNARESPLPPCLQNRKPPPPHETMSIKNKKHLYKSLYRLIFFLAPPLTFPKLKH